MGNDFGDFYTANQVLRNDGDGFVDVGPEVGFREAINCMGLAGGDYNGDGLLDYYATNLGVNYYYEGRPDGTLANVTGVRHAVDGFGTSWGTAQVDLNNDGLLDIVTAKGSLNAGVRHDPSVVYVGQPGRSAFSRTSADLPDVGFNKARGLAYGDLNGDGLLDVVTVGVRATDSGRARTQIMLNTTPDAGHFLTIRLYAEGSAAGSRVTAFAGGQRWTVEAVLGGSYASTSTTGVHIGLGTFDHLDSLAIDWAAGERQVLPGPILVDRTLSVNKTGILTTLRDQRAAEIAVRAFPNPVVDRLFLQAESTRNSREHVSIIPVDGGRGVESILYWVEGAADIVWPGELATGTYLVRGENWVVRVVAGK